MQFLLRILIIIALGWLATVLFLEIRDQSAREDSDPMHIVALFLGILCIAIALATVFALSVVPALGDRIAGLVYNPDEQIEKNPHTDALTKVAAGDYEGAIREYEKVYQRNSEDSLALTEIVHLQCDKLHDYHSAARLLESELEREWPPDQAAFLGSRLVDVYWNYQQDAVRAREVLIQIAENLPDTKHAANAQHRLREIDRALIDKEAGLSLPSSESPADESDPVPPEDEPPQTNV